MNRQPPRMFWTLTLPPWASTRPRTIARPSPPAAPVLSLRELCGLRARSPRKATSKTWGRSVSGIPPQVSATDSQVLFRPAPASTRIVPSSGVCPPAHLQAVDLGQHQFQDNETRSLAGGARERGGAVRRPGHLVPRLREVDLDDVADGRVVVHDEDPRLHVRSGAPPRSLPSRPQMITPASVATNPPRAVRRPIVDLLQESRSRQRRRAPDRFAALTARFVPNWRALHLCPLLMQAVAIAISRRGMTLMKSL